MQALLGNSVLIEDKAYRSAIPAGGIACPRLYLSGLCRKICRIGGDTLNLRSADALQHHPIHLCAVDKLHKERYSHANSFSRADLVAFACSGYQHKAESVT